MEEERVKEKVLLTVVGTNHYHGNDVLKVGQTVLLKAETDNQFDNEAVMVQADKLGTIGYVANSVTTRVKGTNSAGYVHKRLSGVWGCLAKVILIGGHRDEIIVLEAEV